MRKSEQRWGNGRQGGTASERCSFPARLEAYTLITPHCIAHLFEVNRWQSRKGDRRKGGGLREGTSLLSRSVLLGDGGAQTLFPITCGKLSKTTGFVDSLHMLCSLTLL